MNLNKLLPLSLVLTLFSFGIVAQSQGPNNPTSATASGQGANMPSLSSLYAAGGYTAYADLAAYPTCIGPILCYHSPLITISGFGFTIPTNAQITGIQVDILKFVSQPITTIHDSIVQLSKGGVPVGSNLKSGNQWQMVGSSNYEVYGDSITLWDTTWTPAEVNDPAFGLFLQLSNGNIDQTAQVDHVRMTVYYTLTTSTENIPKPASVFFYQKDNFILPDFTGNSLPNHLQIVDLTGRQVWINNKYTGHPIDVSELASGMYIISYEKKNERFSQKIQIK